MNAKERTLEVAITWNGILRDVVEIKADEAGEKIFTSTYDDPPATCANGQGCCRHSDPADRMSDANAYFQAVSFQADLAQDRLDQH